MIQKKKKNIFYNNEFIKTKEKKDIIDLENINFLDSLENDTSFYETESDNESDSEYLSAADEKEENFENKYNHKDLDYKKSKPINIINKKINNSDEFEIIDVSILKQQSLPVQNKTVTESLKEYLYSSINLIKQSYNYVSSNKSI